MDKEKGEGEQGEPDGDVENICAQDLGSDNTRQRQPQGAAGLFFLFFSSFSPPFFFYSPLLAPDYFLFN